jgi:ADP-ribosylglycohydrolase
MNNQDLNDRIFAMFALGAIGDALGAPVEMMKAPEIAERYGRLTSFIERADHKFGPIAKGETTDDTQLKLAIARSIARSGTIDLDDIAREHILELGRTTRGWGGSTTQAVERLLGGVHWSVSGSTPETSSGKRGKGNGVAMKIDPVGAYCAVRGLNPMIVGVTRTAINDVALMTHGSAMGVASGMAEVMAIQYCLATSDFCAEHFSDEVTQAAFLGECVFPRMMASDEDRLSDRFCLLRDVTPETSDDVLRVKYGNGSCYVYDSLPLAYALFVRKPHSIEALYDAVNFGGDTDTVASIVGSLLGALHGSAIIPQALWAGVDRRAEIETTVAEFIRAVTP